MARTRTTRRPAPGEHAPYHVAYIARVPDGDVVQHLRDVLEEDLALLRSIPDERAGARYEPGKWSIAEVVGHVVDIERTFAYRALCFARGLTDTPQPGVDHDVMVPNSGADERGLASLTREYEHLRRANLELFEGLDDAALDRRGVAADCEVTVRTVLYVIAGHAAHHWAVLRERYL